MLLITSVHNSIVEINEKEWDEIIGPESILQKHSVLLFLERGTLIDFPPKYFVFRTDDGKIAAHAAAYISKTDLLIFSKGIIKKAINKLRKVYPNLLQLSILECGCPISPGRLIGLRKDMDLSQIILPLSQALRKVSKEHGVRVMLLRDFYEKDQGQFMAIQQQGFYQIYNLPTTELSIKWRSYTEYLSAMNTHHRAKVRRGLKLAKQSCLITRIRDEFSVMHEHLWRQWKNVNENAREYSREQLTPEFYRLFNEGFNGNCRLLEVMKGGKLVAHALIVIDGRTLRWMFFGREDGKIRDGAYFITIATIVEFAIENKMKQIEMGLTSYSVKTDFGAQMIPLWMFIHCRGKLLNQLVPKLYKLLNPRIKIRERLVFKKF